VWADLLGLCVCGRGVPQSILEGPKAFSVAKALLVFGPAGPPTSSLTLLWPPSPDLPSLQKLSCLPGAFWARRLHSSTQRLRCHIPALCQAQGPGVCSTREPEKRIPPLRGAPAAGSRVGSVRVRAASDYRNSLGS
jgi:hypothetical protein